jgi:hypothetical protein
VNSRVLAYSSHNLVQSLYSIDLAAYLAEKHPRETICRSAPAIRAQLSRSFLIFFERQPQTCEKRGYSGDIARAIGATEIGNSSLVGDLAGLAMSGWAAGCLDDERRLRKHNPCLEAHSLEFQAAIR